MFSRTSQLQSPDEHLIWKQVTARNLLRMRIFQSKREYAKYVPKLRITCCATEWGDSVARWIYSALGSFGKIRLGVHHAYLTANGGLWFYGCVGWRALESAALSFLN